MLIIAASSVNIEASSVCFVHANCRTGTAMYSTHPDESLGAGWYCTDGMKINLETTLDTCSAGLLTCDSATSYFDTTSKEWTCVKSDERRLYDGNSDSSYSDHSSKTCTRCHNGARGTSGKCHSCKGGARGGAEGSGCASCQKGYRGHVKYLRGQESGRSSSFGQSFRSAVRRIRKSSFWP